MLIFFLFSSVMFILFSFVFVFMSRFPISGAIMFASPHFRRERFEPGCSDGPGSPGTGPTQAAAAPVICCLRTPSTPAIAWPKWNRTTPSRCHRLLKQSSNMFLKGTVSMIPNRNISLHFSILGEVISISIELFLKTWLIFVNET